MFKVKRKLLTFLLAGVIALSCSLSAVAEEVIFDEVVTEEAVVDEMVTEEAVVIDDVLDIDHICTDDHEHEYDEVTNIYASIMATAGCPHSMTLVPGSSGSNIGPASTHSYSGGFCSYATVVSWVTYVCSYGCGYSHTPVTTTVIHGSCGA